MSDFDFSRRFFLSGAAATAPALATMTDRIAEFLPPPDRVRIMSMNTRSVVAPPSYSDAEIKQITSQGKNVEWLIPKTQADMDKMLPEANVMVGSINAATLAKAKNLKWLQATEAGMETTLFPELTKSDVVVTNMARIFAHAISETAIAMLLAHTRGLNNVFIPGFQKRTFNRFIDLREIDGLTMGVVGLGGLGSMTAMRAHYGFNMKILAVDAKPMVKPIFVDTLREPAWLMEMVPQVDILVNACPSTPANNGMFNDAVFRAMKKTAYFISISRGMLVDQNALIAALNEKRIAGACLDVVTPEPLPKDSPLWDCPNTIITCHTAGFAPERRIRLMGLIAENVRRFANGLPLMNVVDKVRGY